MQFGRLTCYMTFILLLMQNSWAAPMGQRRVSNNVSAAEVAKIEAQAKQASQEKQKIEQQANKVKRELDNINQKMIAAAKKIQNGEDLVREKQERLQQLQEHLSESEQKFSAEHSMLVDTLSALQNLALRPSEAILVQPLSPVEVMRSSILLRGGVHALEGRAEFIRRSIEDISSQKEEIAKNLQDLEAENKQLEQQQDEMQRMIEQKGKMYTQLSARSKEAQEKAKILASQAGNLRDLLDKLEKQKAIQRQQMAEKERQARSRAAAEMRITNNHSYKPQEQLKQTEPTGFGKAKGKLSRPARGPIVTAFHQEMSKGVASNGIDIKTAAKAQVIAPYDGTVLFAGPFKNFANLLIIDHGEGYTSLLSGLASTNADVGQMLLAGEPVGTMPSGDNVKLHMEIRKNNQPIDPAAWLNK